MKRRSTGIMRNVVALALYIAMSIYIFRVSLFENNPRYVSLVGDLAVPTSLSNLISDYYPLWSGHFSKSNLMVVSRYPVLLPFFLMAKIFNLHPMTSIEIFWVITGIIAGFSSYLAANYILKNEFGRENESIIFLASIFSGFFYLINPFFANEARHMIMRFSHALLPLVFLSFLLAHEKKRFSYILLASLVWALIASNVRGVIFAGILLPVSLVYAIKKFQITVKDSLKTSLKIILLFFLLSSFYFIPYFMSLKAAGVSPGYVVSEDKISSESELTFFRVFFSEVPNIFLPGPSIPYYPKIDFIQKLSPILPFLQILIPLLAFGVLLIRKTFTTLLFSILALMFLTVLSIKELGFLWNFYIWFTLYSPISSSFGWLFRKTYDFYSLYMFPLSMLLGIAVYVIINRFSAYQKKWRFYGVGTIFIILVSASIVFTSWPLLTGDFNGELKPVKLPDEYFTVNQWLKNDTGNYKVLWFPKYHVQSSTWRENRVFKWIDDLSSSKPTYFISLSGAKRTENAFFFEFISSIRYRWKDDVLLSQRTDKLGNILCPLNVKYLMFHNDIPNKLNKTALETLYSQKDMKPSMRAGFIHAFENTHNCSQVYTPSAVIAAENLGLDKIVSIGKAPGMKLKDVGVIFRDTDIKYNNLEEIKIADIIITGDSRTHKPYGNLVYVEPFSSIKRHKPEEAWSRHRTSDPGGGNWRVHLLGRGIENWDFDYGRGIVFTWAKKASSAVKSDLERKGNYKLFIRYFKNQEGGEIKVYLDGKPIEIKTKDQLNKFVWKELGTFKLERGEHEIVLENVEGFNAVNLFALIPEEEYYKEKEEVEKILQNKTMIYLFEAESDLYRSNAETTKNINASNGEMIAFGENGKAWQDVEIVKNGTYRIALKGMGEFNIKIGENSFILKPNTLNFTYSPLLYLDEGKYRLEITPLDKASKLDVVWLYSTETDQTIEQLFEVKEKPAKIINYTKVNPTLWKVKVNATKPFMLSFAESYDPLWEARVYKDGKLVEKVKSIPLYSVINGFWINETGNLEIVIRYKPQDWFETGLIISATTFIACIGYIFYDWRKGKGDGWARGMERKIKIF